MAKTSARQVVSCGLIILTMAIGTVPVSAQDVEVQGTDIIFLAGRTDVTIPPLSERGGDANNLDPSFPIVRAYWIDPPRTDFRQETFPQSLPASGGQRFTFNAPRLPSEDGGYVHYGVGDGGGSDWQTGTRGVDGGYPGYQFGSTNVDSLGGISGYKGPQGALVGVFLDDANPKDAAAPATLDFSTAGIGKDFENLTPALGQVFFIGDGYTSDGLQQIFVAPPSATRLFLGTADAYAWNGHPGFYEDNNGYFFLTVSQPLEVAIDVKPGSDPNCFNLNGHGVIPVAILGGPDLDVATVNTDPNATYPLSFNSLDVRVRGNKGPLCSIENANADEYLDLVCHFEDDAAQWLEGTEGSGVLRGELLNGTLIEGSDSICIVP